MESYDIINIMQAFLSQTERSILREAHLASRSKRYADRIKTILLLDKGWPPSEIADALIIDESTIYRYHQRFHTGGLDALIEDNYQGGRASFQVDRKSI